MKYFEIERDIEDFLKNNKIVVNCKTEEDAEEFLNFLASKYQMKWGSEKKSNEITYWFSYKENTCYRAELSYLNYGSISFYEENDYKILVYKNIKPESIVESKLNIKSSKKRRIFIIENNEWGE